MKKDNISCDCDIVHPQAIELVESNMLKDKTLTELSHLFHMFSSPTRTKICVALASAELCVCDIASIMKMSKSAVSHQLAILKDAKLVKNRREGKNIYYSLDDNHVYKIIELGLEHIQEK